VIDFIKEIYQEIDSDKTYGDSQQIPEELTEKITVQQYQNKAPTVTWVVKYYLPVYIPAH
jgi:hypothetical protein